MPRRKRARVREITPRAVNAETSRRDVARVALDMYVLSAEMQRRNNVSQTAFIPPFYTRLRAFPYAPSSYPSVISLFAARNK